MNDAEEQRAAWNGHSGKVWVESQKLLDQVLQPFEDAIFEAELGPRVLDVGCGTGSATLRAARSGTAVGVDISAPMLARARERAEAVHLPATFIEADAGTYEFAAESFDTIISRFGVMFFEDPVKAFQNLRRAGKRLRAVAWRSAAENEFMTTAERAVGSMLPSLPPRRPNAPGQFAFANHERVIDVLRASGWHDIDVAILDVTCSMPATQIIPYATRLGPVGRILQESDEATRARVTEKLSAAFAHYIEGNEVRFPAAGWMITAS